MEVKRFLFSSQQPWRSAIDVAYDPPPTSSRISPWRPRARLVLRGPRPPSTRSAGPGPATSSSAWPPTPTATSSPVRRRQWTCSASSTWPPTWALDAVELTSYYFPENVSSDYLHRLKQHAFLQGLDVSGTAVMNDFCLPPGPAADKEVEHVRTWIGHAAELDAPMIRVLSGNWLQGTPDLELEQRVIQRIESLLPYAVQKGVILALENHGGGVTVTAEQLLRLVRAIKGPNFGVNLDTGNFHGPDPYCEIAQAAPYAVNVQVKTEIRRRGQIEGAGRPCPKVVGILRDAKYSGYVVLEYNAPEDPKTAVPRYLKALRSLISLTKHAPIRRHIHHLLQAGEANQQGEEHSGA